MDGKAVITAITAQGDNCLPGSITLSATFTNPYSNKTGTKSGTFAYYSSLQAYSGRQNHTLVAVPASAAGCETAGNVAYNHCMVCGKNFDNDGNLITDTTAPATGHVYVKHEAVPSTCVEHGTVEYYECSECGKIFDKDGNPLASTEAPLAEHKLEKVEAKDATCETEGNVAFDYCSVCGHAFDEDGNEFDPVIPATGHQNLEFVDPKDATCTEDGNISYWQCLDCSKKFKTNGDPTEIPEELVEIEDTVIPALGHQILHADAIEPTCTEAGCEEFYVCTECTKYFLDADATQEVAFDDLVIPATGHLLEKVEAKEATCTEDGNIGYLKCVTCGKLFDEDNEELEEEDVVVPALGHTPGEPVKEGDEYVVYCEVCEAELSREAIPHTWKFVDRVDPTCEEDGVKSHYECEDEDCDELRDTDMEEVDEEDIVIPEDRKSVV